MSSNIDELKIVRDLRSANCKYIDSAKGDVMNAMRVYKDLKTDVELYMYPDSKKRHAFKLYGTIPVQYKGGVYNIPISIHLWDTHPYYAPICSVNPTPAMIIRESEHVNKQGRVFLPYLNEWRFPGYDLYGLIQMMVMIFQDKCPVFAKPAGGSSTSTTTTHPQPPSFTPPTVATPYPTDNHMPYPSISSSSSTPYPSSSTFPTPSYPSYTPQTGGRVPPPVPPPHTDTIRSSLVSAVEEKLRSRLRDSLGTTYAEMASMRQTQTELKAGSQKIKNAIDTLERQNRALDEMISNYQSRKSDMGKALEEVNSSETPSIDDAIQPASPLERQLFEAYAADLACDDAYYVLKEALKRGALTPSDYLKHIRDVSRRQFVHRATMRKCRIAAGLPT